MRRNILVDKSSSNAIIISILCLISIMAASCDNMRFSMIPENDPVPEDIIAVGDMPPVTVVDPGDVPPPEPSFPEPSLPPETPIVVDPGDVPPPEPPVWEPIPPPEPPVSEPVPPPEPPVSEPVPPEPPVWEPMPPILRVGDEVIVRNTLNFGILILDAPRGARIGGMFDGETGVVISDSRDFGGLTWVEIKWDAPVKNPKSGCGIGAKVCIGWSAVFIEDGTRIIHER